METILLLALECNANLSLNPVFPAHFPLTFSISLPLSVSLNSSFLLSLYFIFLYIYSHSIPLFALGNIIFNAHHLFLYILPVAIL